MSYWIYLEDVEGQTLRTEPFEAGGTQAVGGSTECELNVTYNYAKLFAFRELHGKTGKDTIDQLREKIAELGTAKDSDDYWECTPGNVGRTLSMLAAWATAYPEGTWEVH